MRVSADIAQLDIAPGDRAEMTLNVVNTGSVIDGISARVVGMPERNVTTRPAVLPLFPDSTGQLTVTLGLPQSFPAGRHPMTVEVLSRQPNILPSYVNVDLLVPRVPAIDISSRPEIVRAHRTGRFILTVTNRGNVPLDVTLTANDPQKLCGVRAQPPAMTLAAGTAGESVLTVRGPRHIMGTDLDRTITVQALARPTAPPAPAPVILPGRTDTPPGGPDAVPGEAEAEPLADLATITFRQRPYFTRGLMTALILVAIIALWAAAFLFGLAKVFAADPMTKEPALSFFAATPATGQPGASGTSGASGTAGASGTSGAGGPGGVTSGATGAPGTGAPGAAAPGAATSGAAAPQAAPPPGALLKNVAAPAGVGGTISGTVTAVSSGDPVGRILVEALRVKADGTLVPKPAASAATQADGSYQISGLFPAKYVLRLSAAGVIKTSYFPAAPTPAAATPITVGAGAITGDRNAVVTGLPATITGTVDPGGNTAKVTTTVTAQLLKSGSGTPAAAIPPVTTTPGENVNSYTIPNLPAPGNYQLTFTTPGYQVSTVQVSVSGGAQRFESTVVLSAGLGQIVGTVTDGANALGGATVSTTVGGQQITTGTPTTGGDIGHFVLANLPTPGTYVVTVSKQGYGEVSQVVALGPGESQTKTIPLVSGTGEVDGVLQDASGVGIGGATVTVGGMANPPSTVTLTGAPVGSFHLTGLPVPGSYTLTFSLAGFADQTVPVTLVANQQLPPLKVVMTGSVGSITGIVTGPSGAGIPGATVTATDGQHAWPVITTGGAAGGTAGGYTVANLPAGLYTVTAKDTAGHSQTTLLTVTPGTPTTADFQLTGG